jgi:DNA-directed RNA polymerase subunit RPC12/RpoP
MAETTRDIVAVQPTAPAKCAECGVVSEQPLYSKGVSMVCPNCFMKGFMKIEVPRGA